jgi:hypothetical protein
LRGRDLEDVILNTSQEDGTGVEGFHQAPQCSINQFRDGLIEVTEQLPTNEA